MILAALVWAAALQDPQTVTVVERLEFTPAQSEALAVISSAAREAGECAAHLPEETRALFRAGVSRVPMTVEDIPDGPPLSLPDVVFYTQFARSSGTGARPTASQCEGRLADARLLVEAQKPAIQSLIELSPSETDRPWDRIGQAAVDRGDAARSRPELAQTPANRAPGSVQVGPAWAETPRVPIPSAARQAHRVGWARIECIVTTQGRARDCRLVAESAEGFGFGDAALRGEDGYRFRASTVDGEPVEARGVFTVHFRF